jgi:type I restriction enzyme, S subunit
MVGSLPCYADQTSSDVLWLGDRPLHWQVRRLKSLARIRYGLGQPPREMIGGLPLIRATNVERGRIVAKGMIHVDPTDVPTGRVAILRVGEIVVVRSGAYTADSAIVPLHYDGAVTGYDMVVTAERILPEFLAHALLSPYVQKDQLIVASMRSAQPHLNAEELGVSLILLPPLAEQEAIVRFLDHADRRIRRYISAKQKLIALLEEQKQAIIHRAVTRGLDPNVQLKPSGVEWLGDVSEHWEVVRNGRLFAQRNETGFPDLPILEVSLKTGVRVREFDASARKQVMSDREGYKKAEAGDLAYNMMRMWQGAVGVVPTDGLVSPAYVVAAPHAGVDSRYFAHLFRTRVYCGEVDKYSRGIVKDRNRLYWEDFKRMASPHPPASEQRAIADWISDHTATIDAAQSTALALIELLREYRTRLISDAVTGKLDVREAAARLPDEVGEDEEAVDEAEAEDQEPSGDDGAEDDAGEG